MLPYRENVEDKIENSCPFVFMNHRHTPGQMAAEHWHPCFELLYVFGGEAKQIIGSHEFSFHAGDTLLIPSGMVHATSATQEDCYIGVTQFPYHNAFPGYYLPTGKVTKIAELFTQIQQESTLKQTGSPLIAQGTLLQILGLLQRYGTPLAQEDSSNEEGQQLEEYIRLHLANNLTLQLVADHVGYTPTYFSKYFSNLMGMPFKRYVDRMKMQAARGMLSDGQTTASVAAALGYDTPSTFCRAFKRLTGQTPSEYQEKNKKIIRK